MPTKPTRSILGCSCARTAGGHAAAAPPSSVMKSRRRIWIAMCPSRGRSCPCNRGTISRFERAVCDYFTLGSAAGADCKGKPRWIRSPLSRWRRAVGGITGTTVQRNGSRPVLCVSLQTVISLRSFSRRGTAAKPVLNGRRISPSYFRLCVSVRSYTGLKLDGGLSRSHAGPAAVPPEPTRCTAALVSISPNETLWNISPRSSGSLRLDAGELDHLGPLLGIFGDQLTEVGGRAGKRRAAQVGKLRLDFRVGERGINLPVELVDDFGRRAFG